MTRRLAGPLSDRLELPAELPSVPAARHWVQQRCGRYLSAERGHVLALLTTELVANGVRYGRGAELLVEVAWPEAHDRTGEVVVACSDSSTDGPVLKRVAPDATGGRGVALIDALAAAWGTEPVVRDGVEVGKRVWFRLTAHVARRARTHHGATAAEGAAPGAEAAGPLRIDGV